jgi:dCMP deaminase
LSLGYNGNYKGGPHEPESPEPGQSGFIHAEINALIKLDYNNPKDKIMYVTLSPCLACAKATINAGVKKVYYGEEYRDVSGLELLSKNGIQVQQIRL